MKCSNVIVPGFEQTNKIKNTGLEAVLMRDFGKDVMSDYREVSALYVDDYKGKRHYIPAKKVVLYHGTPASELEGGQFDINRWGNQGTDWMLGTHATPDINVAKGYYEDGGSVFSVGYNIDKMWHLSGNNKINPAMLKDYTEFAKQQTEHPEDAIHAFKTNGRLKYMDREQQRNFLVKHGYNLVLDGSQRVVMLSPTEDGTMPVKLNTKEISKAEERRKKSDKYLSAFYKLDTNRRKSQARRDDIDERYKEERFDRSINQLLADLYR